MTDDPRSPLILHISSEYLHPDRPPPITDAVLRLVDRMTDHPQIVISLLRVGNPGRMFWRDLGELDGRRVIVHGYFAPPWGIGMFTCQMLVARRIRRFLAAENLSPDIVHAHRFTFEGIAAWLLSRRLGTALFFSVRGEVEGKVFSVKPTYRWLFRRMAKNAARIYYVSAWFRKRFEKHTGVDPLKTRLLPNVVLNARSEIPPREPQPRIISAMSLRAFDKKGLPELIAAFALAGQALAGVTLEVIGEGPPEAYERVRALAKQHGVAERVGVHKRMANEALLDYMTGSLALAMPSHNETFGMVYPEALFAGIPILYSAGTGIHGYLDGLPVGVAVEPGNIASIAEGLTRLVRDNAVFRTVIRDNAAELYDRFSPATILERYRADIAAIADQRRPSRLRRA